MFDFQHSVTDVIKVVNYHNCYFAQNVPAIITVTAVHLLFVLQSLSGWAGNVLNASLVRPVGEFLNAVEPLLSGYPWGNGMWLLNRGWPLKKGWRTFFTFGLTSYWSWIHFTAIVTNVCLNLFLTGHLLFCTLFLPLPFLKPSFIILGGH